MVSNRGLTEETIWKQAKKIKADLSLEECSYLRNNSVISKTFEKMSNLLNATDISDKAIDLSREDIIKGANFFIFLNSCPANEKDSKNLKDLYGFFINLEPWNPTISGMILYTINHMKKAPEDFRNISHKLLKYFASKLGFQYILPGDTETIFNKEFDIPKKLLSVQDKNVFKMVSNHPVHILDKDKNRSPSSLIPFCAFGNDMEAMGTKIEGFDLPVCNSFEEKVRNDQLCYEIDLNKYIKDKHDIENKLKEGLVLIMDLNEDRQLKEFWPKKNESEKETAASQEDKTFEIHLDTISKIIFIKLVFLLQSFCLDPMTLTGEGQYNINALKEIKATDSFLTLDDEIRGCRSSEESHDDCTTRLYLDNMRQKCDCLPFSVASQEVRIDCN